MGIPTDPGYRLYVGNNFCFPTGKTPKKLFISFSGIAKGTDALPEDPEPFNRTFIAETTDNVHWTWTDGIWYLNFFLLGNASGCFLGYSGYPIMFYFYTSETCIFSGTNINIYPEHTYFGGSFVAIPRD